MHIIDKWNHHFLVINVDFSQKKKKKKKTHIYAIKHN